MNWLGLWLKGLPNIILLGWTYPPDCPPALLLLSPAFLRTHRGCSQKHVPINLHVDLGVRVCHPGDRTYNGDLFVFILLLLEHNCLQRCVTLCHTTAWISYVYTRVPSRWSPPPAPQGHPRPRSRAPCAVPRLPTSSLTAGSVCVSTLPSHFCPPSPPSPHQDTYLWAPLLSLPMKMPDTHLGEEEGKEGISKTQLLSKTGFFFFLQETELLWPGKTCFASTGPAERKGGEECGPNSDFGSAWVGGPPLPTEQGRVEGKRPQVLVLTGLRKAGPRPARPKLQLVSPPPEK